LLGHNLPFITPYTLARWCESVLKATKQVNGKAKIRPTATPNSLTDVHKNWQAWFCPGWHPTCTIL